MDIVGPARMLRFGIFEFDLRAGELLKSGRKVPIQEQPFRVLAALLEHPGEVVSREELQRKVWPTDTFVDFDTAINKAVAKIREALSDSADSPRFVETLPRRGYRFIAPVTVIAPPALEPEQLPPPPLPLALPQKPRWKVAAAVLTFLLLVGVVWAWTSHDQTHPRLRSIAVLPLQNLSGDPGQEYFVDGMTDELITDLAQIHSLKVISRTSIMQFKQTKKTLPQIANELHVDAIVEGSVLQSQGSVRVTAQLLDGHQDRHLWAASYERRLDDVVGLQRQVAQAIADQVRAELTPQEHASLARQHPTNPEAFEAMLKGRFYANEKTPEAVEKAVVYYQRAVEIDPGDAEAWAGLGGCYASLGADLGVVSPAGVLPKARAAIAKAITLDDKLSAAHLELGRIKLWYDWDWKGADSEIRRAIDLNPNDALAYALHARYLSVTKRFDEAVAEDQRAIEIAPLDTLPSMQLAWIYRDARRPEKALEQSQRVLAKDPAFVGANFFIGAAYEEEKKWPEAIAAFNKLKDVYQLGYLEETGHAWAASGQSAEAEDALAQLRELSKQKYVHPVTFAIIYTALGRHPVALDWLERAYRERDTGMIAVGVDYGYDDLRGEPRFRELIRLMAFP